MTDPLSTFNALPDDDASRLLESCAAVPRWADDVMRGRPYGSVEEVLEAARTAADPWTEDEIDAALARHPRIGERPQGSGADAAHSRAEQAGVDTGKAGVAEQLARGNRAYEDRFGHVFLIRAAGRSAEDILATLQQRLTNDPATERRIAAEQLRQIAVLRLQKELT